jgi:hypothetical protein
MNSAHVITSGRRRAALPPECRSDWQTNVGTSKFRPAAAANKPISWSRPRSRPSPRRRRLSSCNLQLRRRRHVHAIGCGASNWPPAAVEWAPSGGVASLSRYRIVISGHHLESAAKLANGRTSADPARRTASSGQGGRVNSTPNWAGARPPRAALMIARRPPPPLSSFAWCANLGPGRPVISAGVFHLFGAQSARV